MTEYTVVLKNGHCFRVEADVPLPCALREADAAGIPVIEQKTFALAVDEVAAIYPTKNGERKYFVNPETLEQDQHPA